MTEEIKTRQTAEETTSAVESGQRAITSSARYGAERNERKPMVPWAALLEEAVQKPGFRAKKPVPAAAQAALTNGYDNSLAYLDVQIGDLVHFIESSPVGKNTIFIITADHGESLGEHDVYGHGDDVNREEIHVPPIVYGAGIPAGKRIAPPVPIRRLFGTVLDLALGNALPMHQHSLARFWVGTRRPAAN